MENCNICVAIEFRADLVSEIFEIDGRRVLVENIPVQICVQCGEMFFSRETAEKVRRMIHGEAEAVGVVELELYEFA